MSRKLLACDLDGTLLFPTLVDGQTILRMTESDTLAIAKFRKAGHLFSLCTGRSPKSVERLISMEPCLQADAFILASGGILYKDLRLPPLHSHFIPAQAAAEFVAYFHQTKKFTVYWSTPEINYGLLERDPSKEKAHHITSISLHDWTSHPCDVISMGLTPFSRSIDDAQFALDYIKQRWPEFMSPFRNKIYIDVCAGNIDKGKGIHTLVHLLDSDLEYFAIGDAHNDIPMFEGVGKKNAFLMDTGILELSPFVNRIVKSVAECIEHILS